MLQDYNQYLIWIWFIGGIILLIATLFMNIFSPFISIGVFFFIMYSTMFSLKTSKENYGTNTLLYKIFSNWDESRVKNGKVEKWKMWYVGGNSKYNPAYLWTQDCWHFINDSLMICLILSIIFFTGYPIMLWLYILDAIIFRLKHSFFKTGKISFKEEFGDWFTFSNLHKTDDGSDEDGGGFKN